MSKNISHPDFIDAYLKQKLSEAEKLSFERQLQKDPLLQNEVNLQREIQGTLAEVRKAELKARLDAIPVETPVAWYSLSTAKWMAAVVTVVTLSVGAYLYFYPEKEEEIQPFVVIEENAAVAEKEIQPDKPTPIEELVEQQPLSESLSEKKKSSTSEAKTKEQLSYAKDIAIESEAKTINEAAKLPRIVRPDVAADFDDDFQTKEYDDVLVPEKGLAQVEGVTAPEIEIENEMIEGYDFHYRYQDNKLYLYGDFKGIPYEILALNTAEKIRLFLKYDTNFYMINQAQTEIIPLQPIENQALIKELKIVSNFK